MLYYNKDLMVLIDPYVMNESKLKEGIVALWPPVNLDQIYSYFRDMPGEFTWEKMKFRQELRYFYLLLNVSFSYLLS